MTRLNNKNISGLRPGETLRDDVIPGLHVKAGKRRVSFYLYFKTKAGVERRPKVGSCSVLTVSEARDIARSWLAVVAQGGDPVRSRGVAREALTMARLWHLCEKEYWNRGRQWDREARRLYYTYVDKSILDLKVTDVNYSTVSAIHKSLINTPNQANRVISVLSKMLNHAERLEIRPIGSNPCARIVRYPERKRRRFATPEELSKIGPLLDLEAKDHPSAVAFIYLLLFSGARPSEIARATWDQFDGQALRIPEGKTGERTVFLPVQATRILGLLPRDRGTITGLKAVPKALWNRVRQAAGCPDLWARDSRRTFATVGLSNGITAGQIGELLGHKSAQTTKIYTKLMEAPAFQASTSIGNKMEELLNPSV